MKSDISDRKDIENLVTCFYDEVKTNETIGFFFSEVVQVQWEKHIPVMVDFWENVLFYSGSYEGNPMEIHRRLDQKHKLTKEHFDTWTKIFVSTVNRLYEGEQAENIKQRAQNIATVMQTKLFNDHNFIR